ncbi:MAG: SLC13 family permease [Pirellulales bacterium]|nr:SLC13 family permease [Pirellulales bacterium]
MNLLAALQQPVNWQTVIALAITALVFVTLFWKRGAPTDLVFLAGLVGVTLCQIVTPKQALLGFANPAVVTIAALYVVAAGLRHSGALDLIGNLLLGDVRTEKQAVRRLMFPIVALSALINNTPIVAMTVPTVIDWCRRTGVSPSRMLIPISYLAILGGACSLIGTSTNLVVNGLMVKHPGIQGMHLFEIGYVGLPCAIIGTLYLMFAGRHLLPNRTDLLESIGAQRRDYLVEMLVRENCRLIGKTVEQAGLRNLPGLFLIEINRESEVITPVTPRDRIEAGDRLIFTGVVSTIVDLEKIPGLVPAVDSAYEIDPAARQLRHLTEAVLSNSSPLIGSTVKEARFRQLYNAAVLAVHRNGVRMTNKVGSIQLEPGDTLLLQTQSEFLNNFRNSRDFYLVSGVGGDAPRRHDRVWVSLSLLGLLVALLLIVTWRAQTGDMPEGMTAIVAVMIAGMMVGTRCLSMAQAHSAFELQVLITVGAALGLGEALEASGAATAIASGLIGMVNNDKFLLLVVTYILTLLFTEMITNTAVAALMFPLAVAVAQQSGLEPKPFIMAIALAASCSFLTPIGYQTNLMVMGPGGYRPIDYFKVGLPLTVLVMITSLTLIPYVWPL